MNAENQNQAEHVRDEQTIAKLKDLSQKLLSGDINKARLAAHQLSWMQEDGFTLLKMALFGRYNRDTKKAAAYGLRRMKGRMKKAAIALLQEGLNDRDRMTKAASKKALQLMKILPPDSGPQRKPKSKGSNRPSHPGAQRIQNIPAREPHTRTVQNRPMRGPNSRPER